MYLLEKSQKPSVVVVLHCYLMNVSFIFTYQLSVTTNTFMLVHIPGP